MNDPNWTDKLAAWSTFATAVLTFLILAAAVAAWRTGKATLTASREANEQARRDSIEQTRPYIYAEVIPGLGAVGNWDLRIHNSGKSSARQLTLEYDKWPDDLDDVATSLRELFETPRTLPPGSGIRAMWRLVGPFTDGTTEAGLGGDGAITVSYTSDDPSGAAYTDTFDVLIERSGFTPVGEQGPKPDGLEGEARMFYLLGQALVRRVAELKR